MKKEMKTTLLFLALLLLAACSPAPGPAGSSASGSLAAPGLGLGLTGRLILIQYDPDGSRLVELDLPSGELRVLFQAPARSWLAEAALSPDGQRLLLAYAPPPPEGQPQFAYTDLYLAPSASPEALQPFRLRQAPEESFVHPTWDPTGESVYYTRLYRLNPDEPIQRYGNDIERAWLAGEVETVLPRALWPALSPDGSRLAYLTTGPDGQPTDLYLAGADGSRPAPLLPAGSNPVDAHLFTPDGAGLIFSMVTDPPAAGRGWLEKLFWVRVASAHSVPSDWYRLPLAGGTPHRLTDRNEMGLAGDLSPDGSHLAYISAAGLYILPLDGSAPLQVSPEVYIGSVDWVP